MARKTIYVDDLDGTEIAEDDGGPITFSLGDDRYQLDLSSKNLAKLTKALQPFVDKAAKLEAPPREPTRGRATTTRRTQLPGKGKDYLDAVRRWARENGHVVADRGRIKADIVDAYEVAKKSS